MTHCCETKPVILHSFIRINQTDQDISVITSVELPISDVQQEEVQSLILWISVPLYFWLLLTKEKCYLSGLGHNTWLGLLCLFSCQ